MAYDNNFIVASIDITIEDLWRSLYDGGNVRESTNEKPNIADFAVKAENKQNSRYSSNSRESSVNVNLRFKQIRHLHFKVSL